MVGATEWDEQGAGDHFVALLTALDSGEDDTYARLLEQAVGDPSIAFPALDMGVKLYFETLKVVGVP